jgi:hypothetical protein
VNDNAEIAALGVSAFASFGGEVVWTFLVAGLAMTAGSYVAGFRVSRTGAAGKRPQRRARVRILAR